jgi:hypothetical protein
LKLLPIALAIVTGFAAPAFAADAPSTAVKGAESANPSKDTGKPEKLICTRETPTGSTIPVRVCRTRSQMEQERRATEQMQSQNRSVGSNPVIPR